MLVTLRSPTKKTRGFPTSHFLHLNLEATAGKHFCLPPHAFCLYRSDERRKNIEDKLGFSRKYYILTYKQEACVNILFITKKISRLTVLIG
jgi:hypothetical protein